MHDAGRSRVEVSIISDDDCILAAHFSYHTLDPKLSFLNLGRAFVYAQAYFFRASEGDETSLWMIDDDIADFRAGAGHEIHHTRGHPSFFKQFKKLVGDRRRVRRRLEHHGVARHNRRCRHARHYRQRKVPWRNHCAYSERNVIKMIVFAGQLYQRLPACVSQHLMGIKLAEVDRFGSVPVRLRPGLRHCVNHPGRQFMFALPHQVSRTKEQLRALFSRNVAPGLKGFVSTLDRAIREFLRSFVEAADDLRPIRRIKTLKHCTRFNAFAANDERIFFAQLAGYLLERGAHDGDIFFFAEIS